MLLSPFLSVNYIAAERCDEKELFAVRSRKMIFSAISSNLWTWTENVHDRFARNGDTVTATKPISSVYTRTMTISYLYTLRVGIWLLLSLIVMGKHRRKPTMIVASAP